MLLMTNSVFKFTPPYTKGCNIKSINRFAAIKAAHSLVLCAAFFVCV